MKKSKRALITAAVMSLSTTSSMLNVMAEDRHPAPVYGPAPTIYGDADDDGRVKISDAVLLARYVQEDPVTISQFGKINADYNLDGELTMEDVTLILRDIARLPIHIGAAGDINNNGYLDLSDLQKLMQRYTENTDTDDYKNDVNNDYKFTTADLYLMRELLLDMGYADADILAVFDEYGVWIPTAGTTPYITTTRVTETTPRNTIQTAYGPMQTIWTTPEHTACAVYGTTPAINSTTTIKGTTIAPVYGTTPAAVREVELTRPTRTVEQEEKTEE